MRFYVDGQKLTDQMKADLAENNIKICPYNDIYEDIKKLNANEAVLVDPDKLNYALYNNIPSEAKVIEQPNPEILMKAMKNETEIKNIINAHIKDGVAVTRFMYWLKNLPADAGETEVSAADYLRDRRNEQEGYFEDSFATISAYKENAAMMHYHPGAVDVPLKQEGMLLVDSGGQYMDGTTDITRTFVLGPITDEEKKWFTKALRGHIRLEKAKFLHGCRGLNLDILARGPMWEEEIDYQCGTGHGVGHVSNVHEAPNGFRWKIVPERNDSCVLEPGMITSDEPGVYEEGVQGCG